MSSTLISLRFRRLTHQLVFAAPEGTAISSSLSISEACHSMLDSTRPSSKKFQTVFSDSPPTHPVRRTRLSEEPSGSPAASCSALTCDQRSPRFYASNLRPRKGGLEKTFGRTANGPGSASRPGGPPLRELRSGSSPSELTRDGRLQLSMDRLRILALADQVDMPAPHL